MVNISKNDELEIKKMDGNYEEITNKNLIKVTNNRALWNVNDISNFQTANKYETGNQSNGSIN